MNIAQSIPAPKAHPPANWHRIFAVLPVAINIGLAASPAFDHHFSLRAVAVLSGLFGGWLMLRLSDRNAAAVSGSFVVICLSHLYVIASAAATDHLSNVNIMGETIGVESALWSCFVFAAVGVVLLVREVSRQPAKA